MKILKNFISIDDLEKRWGLKRKQIEEFLFEGKRKRPKLTMWNVKEFKKGADGNLIAIVEHTDYITWNCIFDMDEVLRWDSYFPDDRNQGQAEVEPPAPLIPSSRETLQTSPAHEQPARTAAASVASQEKTLAAWKAVIPAMCAVYHEYLAEGPRTRTRNEIERDFTKLEAKLSKAQLDFFRSFLPEGHVNKNGGATVQKS